MKANFPLELQHIFSNGDDDAPMPVEKRDAFTEFWENAELEHIGGIDLQKLRAETREFNDTHRQRYLDLAKAAAEASPKVNDNVLAKRAQGGARLEKSENGKWVYQYDERGEMVSGREVNP